MVVQDAFLEWAKVHGNRYGTSKQAIEQRMKMGADVVLEIDFQGAIQVKRIFPNAVLVFIPAPELGRAALATGTSGRRQPGGHRSAIAECRHGDGQCPRIRLRYNQRSI